MLLLPEDKIKFQKAMIDFNEEGYYSSANFLIDLVYAQSIKEILFRGNQVDILVKVGNLLLSLIKINIPTLSILRI